MKRHINALFQRKRADFDSDQYAKPIVQGPQSRVDIDDQVLVKDGYDWLQQLGSARAHVARTPTIHQ